MVKTLLAAAGALGLSLVLARFGACDERQANQRAAAQDGGASVEVPPVYTKLKDLHLTTDLVREGNPHVTVVVPASGQYDALAARIQRAIHRRSGVQVPVVNDAAAEAAVPIRGNLIVLCNRSTNKVKREFFEIDGELIENKDDPLAGPYHYGANMMILYWDLVEESPVFTDEERLRVTNLFSRQFAHPQEQSWRGRIPGDIPQGEAAYANSPACVWSRHETCSAIALYCLGRYFERGYGDPLWAQCMAAAKWRFASLHHHAWVHGEADTLPSYCSAAAPILQYMLLTRGWWPGSRRRKSTACRWPQA